ncbi:hypothetical protein D3C84_746120 [compost metagenome]
MLNTVERVAQYDGQFRPGLTALEQFHHFKAVVPGSGQVDRVVLIVEHTSVRTSHALGAVPDGHNVCQLALAIRPHHIAQPPILIRQRVVFIYQGLEALNVVRVSRCRGVALTHLHLQIDQKRPVLSRVWQLERIPIHAAVRGKRGVYPAHCLHEHLRAEAVIEPEHSRPGFVGFTNHRRNQRGLT